MKNKQLPHSRWRLKRKENSMSFIYLGYSVEAMISFISTHKDTTHFKLEMEENGSFGLIINNSTYGKFQDSGSFTRLLSSAFGRYKKEADQAREEFEKLIQKHKEPNNGN